nr:TnsA endonuclease N-terminal domain-containing protein [Advenella sp. FME57]
MSPNIIVYREQPLKIQYADGDRLRRYTPDFKVTLKTGEIVLVEIKHSAFLARAEIRHKYRQISAHMQRIAQAYCIVTDTTIRQEPRLSSLRYVFGQLTRQIPTQVQLDSVASDLASHPVFLKNASIQEVNSLLKPYGVSVFDLLASGHLVCDLTQPVQESTQTFINKENHHEWFRISEELSI